MSCLASFSHSSEAKVNETGGKNYLGVSGSKELLLDSFVILFRGLWEFLGYSFKSTATQTSVWIHMPSLTSSFKSLRRAGCEISLPGVYQQSKPVQENLVQEGTLALMRVLRLLVSGVIRLYIRFSHAYSKDLLSALVEAGTD